MARSNEEVAHLLEQLADGYELLDENRFRVLGLRRAAGELRAMGRDLRELAAGDPKMAIKRIASLPGIGEGTARRVIEYLETGGLADHRKLLERVPAGLFPLLSLPGLGPKTVQLLWRQLGIASSEQLAAALDSAELRALPRMGEKTITNLRSALAARTTAGRRTPLGLALPLAEHIVAELLRTTGVQRVAYAGSTRRGREDVGDLDILAAGRDPEALRERFVGMPGVKRVLAHGESRCAVLLAGAALAADAADDRGIQCDLRIVPAASWGAALLYVTGAKAHNVKLRQIAIEQDRHLNEFGLFAGTEDRPQERGARPIAARTEEQIYRALGLPYVPPELREDRDEWQGVPGDLLELSHLRAELHSHTTASDGRLTIGELAKAAQERGIKVLAITDHSQSAVVANGLRPDRLRRHLDAIRETAAALRGLTLLAGAEVDIHADGRLDYDDELLAELDLVIASPHAALRQDETAATQRLVRAARHPLVHVLGHPTGRQVGTRPGLPVDVSALCRAAHEASTALEINAQWHRLDLRDSHARIARQHGCTLAVNTDAHTAAELDSRIFGVLTARRAGLARAQCLNTWTLPRLRRFLAKGRR